MEGPPVLPVSSVSQATEHDIKVWLRFHQS